MCYKVEMKKSAVQVLPVCFVNTDNNVVVCEVIQKKMRIGMQCVKIMQKLSIQKVKILLLMLLGTITLV